MANSSEGKVDISLAGIRRITDPLTMRWGLTEQDISDTKYALDLTPMDYTTKIKIGTDGLAIENIGEAFAKGELALHGPEAYFLYLERPMFLYTDVMYLPEEKIAQGQYNKFHLCFCSGLEQAKRENRFDTRYAVTNRVDGSFHSTVYDRWNRSQPVIDGKDLRLDVCQLCLTKLNWHCFASVFEQMKAAEDRGDWRSKKKYNGQRWKIVNTFDIGEFLRTAYKNLWEEAHLKSYWFSERGANRLKELRQSRCDRCGKDFPSDRLAIHHRDLDEGNNDPRNLMVVCESCHAELHTLLGGAVFEGGRER